MLTGSLTDNITSQLTHILYVTCIKCCILRIELVEEKKTLLQKSGGRKNIFTVLYCIY